jgi:hypothetical protein
VALVDGLVELYRLPVGGAQEYRPTVEEAQE